MKILIEFLLISNFALAKKESLETVYAVESDSSDFSHVENWMIL
ncbi:hypothetical protein DFO77_1573 [Marinilabilia salmonicolor]|uniref:Uncharacterized protein n=1 Tax=Marinilabilia salmonicolor TaxID=989 RepID=A0A368UK68_9BACT|nr:hypothetical protein DFO77_1573 [Marinilabilia salmonicolor]